jgi:hypothetical protein
MTGGVGPPVGGETGEVVDEIEHDVEHSGVFAHPADVGVLGSEELLGQLQHLLVVLFGQSEDGEDDLERVVHGDVVGEVATAPHGLHAVDPLCGQGVDAVRHPLDAGRLEPVVDDAPVRLVLVAVHLDERVHGRRTVGAVGVGGAGHDRRYRRVGEHGRVALDLHDVGVTGDGPEVLVLRE